MNNEYSMRAESNSPHNVPYVVKKVRTINGSDRWHVTFSGPVGNSYSTDQWCVTFAVTSTFHILENMRKLFPVDSTHSWTISFAAQAKWNEHSWSVVADMPPLEVMTTALRAFIEKVRESVSDVKKTTAPIRITLMEREYRQVQVVTSLLREVLPEYRFSTYKERYGYAIIGAYDRD